MARTGRANKLILLTVVGPGRAINITPCENKMVLVASSKGHTNQKGLCKIPFMHISGFSIALTLSAKGF